LKITPRNELFGGTADEATLSKTSQHSDPTEILHEMDRSLLPFALLLAGLIAATATSAGAQIDLGVRAGLSVSTFLGSQDPDFSSRLNFTGGLTLRHDLSRNLSIQPEIVYAVKGAATETEIDGVPAEVSFSITYLEFPALIRYSFSPRSSISPVVAAGPSVAWNADARVRFRAVGSDLEFTESDDSVASFDMGVAAEAGVDVKWDLRTVSAAVRYTFGVTDLTDDPERKRRNGSMALTLGLAL
jgi:outer membrane protein W